MARSPSETARRRGISAPTWCAISAAVLLAGSAWAAEPGGLSFALRGEPVARYDLAGLSALSSARVVRVFEPYEDREVTFRAFALNDLLDRIVGSGWRSQEELLFTCRDGYQPTVPVQRALEHRAWLAFDRQDEPGFSIAKLESGERRRISLAPFYLVWENLSDATVRSEGDYGWPYQLVAIDLIRTSEKFPKMAPPAGADASVELGFAAFRVHCSRCHAINGEGGTIGQELNMPVNPVEYRELAWLRRWIDDPSRINPAARMPRMNPAIPERAEVIDRIIDYLEAMSAAKASPAVSAQRLDVEAIHLER